MKKSEPKKSERLFSFLPSRSRSQLQRKKNHHPIKNSSADAADAYEDLEGLRFDDRQWRVDWATPGDFKFFG